MSVTWESPSRHSSPAHSCGAWPRTSRACTPASPVGAFTKDACHGLDALELLARGRHIADALGARLPPSYPDAIEVLLRSLGPEHATDASIGVGMAPFFYLPYTLFVAERGLEHFESLHGGTV
jgi:hypothetical protein